jgi:hypothetical protein
MLIMRADLARLAAAQGHDLVLVARHRAALGARRPPPGPMNSRPCQERKIPARCSSMSIWPRARRRTAAA